MNMRKWIELNTDSLVGKTIAVTGTTGGLGRELCEYLSSLGASLVLVDRNAERSGRLRDELTEKYGNSIECVTADLESIKSVMAACEELSKMPLDIFIHNAGAYSIPRKKCDTGLDNVFEINFASPYFMVRQLLPTLRKRSGRVVVVGSIAHNYSKSDENDIDFSTRSGASLVYGNAKRYLMFSLYELFKNEREVTLSVTHPGITFTNITSHYPKLVFAIIKYPMKLIFMKPKKAALSILRGVFEPTGYSEWLGPHFFNIWGLPKKKQLKTVSSTESAAIAARAEKIYSRLLDI